MTEKYPLLCRLLGHSYPRVFMESYWGGLLAYTRMCTRKGCLAVHRIGEVEYLRKYAGR